MIQTIMYNVSKSAIPMLIYLGIIVFTGFLINFSTKKFDIHKKTVMFGGMLVKLHRRQIISITAVMIRTFLIIYASINFKENLVLYFTMIIMADIVYIFMNPKKIVFEIINTSAQGILIYIISLLSTYRVEISDELYVKLMQTLLIIFIIVYAIYFLFKNFEEIISKKYKITKREKKDQELKGELNEKNS